MHNREYCTTNEYMQNREYSIATTKTMAPVIDIGKYLLPASKRRPVANMQSTKENVSCETNPSKQAVGIAAAAAKMDKATGNVVSATDSSRTPAENMEQSDKRSSVVLIDK